jgi:hypothetical protein
MCGSCLGKLGRIPISVPRIVPRIIPQSLRSWSLAILAMALIFAGIDSRDRPGWHFRIATNPMGCPFGEAVRSREVHESNLIYLGACRDDRTGVRDASGFRPAYFLGAWRPSGKLTYGLWLRAGQLHGRIGGEWIVL